MMKRVFALLLALVMCFAMVACSKKDTDDEKDGKPGTSDTDGSAATVGGGAVETVVGVYDALKGGLAGNTDFSSDMEIKLHVSDEVITLIKQAVFGSGSANVDLKWLNDVSIGLNTAQKNDLTSVVMDLALSNTKIVSLDILMDMANSKLFMGIPELSDKYITAPLGGAQNVGSAQPAWLTMFKEYGDEFLPDGKVVGKLLDKYIDLALKSMALPAEESVELTVSGVTKTVSQQKIVINQKMIASVLTAVLTEAKTDADIKAIVDKFEQVAVDKLGVQSVNLHGEFVKALDDALAEMAATEELSEAALATVTVYTDGDVLAGLVFEMQGKERFNCITLNTADKTATKLNVEDRFAITGSGTIQGGKVNGTYQVAVENTPLVSVELKDFVANDTTVSGTVRLWPEDAMYELLPSEVSSVFEMMDLGLEFVLNSTADKASVTINVLSGETVYLGVTLTAKQGAAANITLPSPDKVVDQTAMQEWAASLDLSKIVENLRKGGLPAELVEFLEQTLTESKQPVPDFNDDFSTEFGEYDDDVYSDFYGGMFEAA